MIFEKEWVSLRDKDKGSLYKYCKHQRIVFMSGHYCVCLQVSWHVFVCPHMCVCVCAVRKLVWKFWRLCRWYFCYCCNCCTFNKFYELSTLPRNRKFCYYSYYENVFNNNTFTPIPPTTLGKDHSSNGTFYKNMISTRNFSIRKTINDDNFY